jgi:hypothetical protein
VDGAPPGRSVMATILWNSLSFLPSFSLFLSLFHWGRKHNRIKKGKKRRVARNRQNIIYLFASAILYDNNNTSKCNPRITIPSGGNERDRESV